MKGRCEMKRKPNIASREWSHVSAPNDLDPRSRARGRQVREYTPPPTVKCPRCGLLGHGVDSHFDQHQFARQKEAIRDEFGNEIGDYNNV